MSVPKGEGGYVFISHSHDDIKTVRKLRNILEENEMDALCFYLKCLNDDTEVFDLIKREIDARKQFIFVDSENSRKSRWVTRERNYVSQYPDKIIHTVEIDDILSSPQAIADKILYSMRIYISYRRMNHRYVSELVQQLQKNDFQVWFDDLITPGTDWMASIDDHIKDACEYGAVIMVLSESSLENSFQMTTEYPTALRLGGFVIPVWIGEKPWESVRDEFLKNYLYLDTQHVIDGHDPIQAADRIVEVIKSHENY